MEKQDLKLLNKHEGLKGIRENKELKLRVGSKKPDEANYRVVNENRKIRPCNEYGKP